MIFDLINPSDSYTFEAPSTAVATVALLFLCQWRYPEGVKDESQRTPCYPFGCTQEAMEAQVLESTGMSLTAYMDDKERRQAVADCLDSILIGDVADREMLASAVARMTPEHGAAFMAEWHDKRRTSMNNIGRRAQQLAEHLRAQGGDACPTGS